MSKLTAIWRQHLETCSLYRCFGLQSFERSNSFPVTSSFLSNIGLTRKSLLTFSRKERLAFGTKSFVFARLATKISERDSLLASLTNKSIRRESRFLRVWQNSLKRNWGSLRVLRKIFRNFREILDLLRRNFMQLNQVYQIYPELAIATTNKFLWYIYILQRPCPCPCQCPCPCP